MQLSVKTKRSGPFAVEELVEQMPAVVEGALGGEGHLVPGPAGVGQRLPGEAVQGLVDGFGLGETGGGVVEVDHLRRLHGKRSLDWNPAISWSSRINGILCPVS